MVIGSAVSWSTMQMRSGTIATTSPFHRAMRFSFWKEISRRSELAGSVDQMTAVPFAKPSVVRRSTSATFPTNNSRMCE